MTFDSNFDSGNLRKAQQTSPTNYRIWIAPDNYKQPSEKDIRVWFHFKISDFIIPESKESLKISIRVMNMQCTQGRNFKEGMKPVYCSKRTNHEWKRVANKVKDICFEKEPDLVRYFNWLIRRKIM